ncbi:MAG: hypothetical protein K2X81_28040, partial [Candidatus Obscuribacterales bacterium]|nr:hypothetical protein [Candidatus Obscuribacterales bacterium]
TSFTQNRQDRSITSSEMKTRLPVPKHISIKDTQDAAEERLKQPLASKTSLSEETLQQFYMCTRYRRFHRMELKSALADSMAEKFQSTLSKLKVDSEHQYADRMTALSQYILVLTATDQEEQATPLILELCKSTPYKSIQDTFYLHTAFKVQEFEDAQGRGQKARAMFDLFSKHGNKSNSLFRCFCIFWDPELTSDDRNAQEARLDSGINELKHYMQDGNDLDDSIVLRFCKQLSKLHYPPQACKIAKLKYGDFESSRGKFDFQMGQIKRSLLQAYFEMKYMDGAERLAKGLRDQYLNSYPQSTLSDDAEAFYLVALRGGRSSIDAINHEALNYVSRVKTCDKARLGTSLESVIDTLGKLDIETPESIYEYIDSNADEFASKDPDISLRLRLLRLYKLNHYDGAEALKSAHELLDQLAQNNYQTETIVFVGSITAITFTKHNDLEAAKKGLQAAQQSAAQASPEANFAYEYARGLMLQKKANRADLRKSLMCWENLLQQWNGRDIGTLPFYYLCADNLAYEHEQFQNTESAMITLGVAQSYLKEYRKSCLNERLQILEHLIKLGERTKNESTEDWKSRVFEIKKVLNKRKESDFKMGLKDFF